MEKWSAVNRQLHQERALRHDDPAGDNRDQCGEGQCERGEDAGVVGRAFGK